MIGAEASENGYIQGAGDDNEGWSDGLSPTIFWKNKDQLLNATEEDMPALIQRLIAEDDRSGKDHRDAVRIGSTNLYIGALTSIESSEYYHGIVICSDVPPADQGSNTKETKYSVAAKTLYLECCDKKLGSRALRSHLPRLLPFIRSLPAKDKPPRILLACSTGKDLSVGVALAVLCLFFNDECMNFLHYPHFPPPNSVIRPIFTN